MKLMSKQIAYLGPIRSGGMLDQLILRENEVLHKSMAGLRKHNESYPVAGANCKVEHEQSGWRNQNHMITITLTFADGRQIVIIQQEHGGAGLKAVASARRFAADVNRVAALA